MLVVLEIISSIKSVISYASSWKHPAAQEGSKMFPSHYILDHFVSCRVKTDDNHIQPQAKIEAGNTGRKRFMKLFIARGSIL